jgi:hypothetical protein
MASGEMRSDHEKRAVSDCFKVLTGSFLGENDENYDNSTVGNESEIPFFCFTNT